MQNKQKRNKLLFYNILMIVCLAFSMAFGLTACKLKTGETALSFETIEQRDYSGTGITYESTEPGIVIIFRIEDIDSLKGLVTDDSINQLQNLDYNQYFALAAFQGRKDSTDYSIEVNHVGRIGNSVNVYAQLHEPSPDIAVLAMETSPYHLVKIQKTGSWGQDITFNLFSGDKLVASLAYTIP